VIEQAEHLARGLLAAPAADDTARIERAYLTALARRPTPEERSLATEYLAAAGLVAARAAENACDAERLSAWTRFAQALLALPEFRFVF
jgi:hypothetical protein